MDADTVHRRRLLARSPSAELEEDPALDAVGGVFFGEPGHGLLGQLQRNEYVRYARDISRRQAGCSCSPARRRCSGPTRCAPWRPRAAAVLPGAPGHVYDTVALTEDNELTLALKTLGRRDDLAPRVPGAAPS